MKSLQTRREEVLRSIDSARSALFDAQLDLALLRRDGKGSLQSVEPELALLQMRITAALGVVRSLQERADELIPNLENTEEKQQVQK